MKLKREDYEIDEKERSVHLGEAGIDKIEEIFILKIYMHRKIFLRSIMSLKRLRAHTLFKIDVDYVVKRR